MNKETPLQFAIGMIAVCVTLPVWLILFGRLMFLAGAGRWEWTLFAVYASSNVLIALISAINKTMAEAK